MAKRQIRIRAALADVRSGLSETELMDKYQLAAKGLQSLLTKLVASGLMTREELERHLPGFMQSAFLSEESGRAGGTDWKIRRTRPGEKPGERPGQVVRAADAIADIKAGMTDSELMGKYRLSSKGLQDLLEQLVKTGLVAPTEVERRMPTVDKTVDLRGFLNGLNLDEILKEPEVETVPVWKCPSCGISNSGKSAVCPACGHGAAAKKAAPKTPANARKDETPVNTAQVLKDVRAGLTDSELMVKHKIPYEKLDQVFRKLLESNAITRGELYGRSSLFLDTVTVDSVPDESEHYLAFPIPVSDAMDPAVVGRLRTVGEGMVGLIGIEAAIDEERSFVVYPEKFVEIQPIAFDAACRWIVREPEGSYAGFEITFISERDRERLGQLVRSLTFGD
ncbi:MAG: Ran-binding zinc finger domain-containing protein [Pseudomonadota bacterium]